MSGLGEARDPLPAETVSELDRLVARLGGEVVGAAGAEAIDVCYRLLLTCIAHKVTGADGTAKTADVVRVLRASTDSVAQFMERAEGHQLRRIPPLH